MKRALIFLVAGLAARDAYALGGPSPGAVSAQTVKLPAGPGSVRGLADDATVSGFTGQVSYEVPIELPSAPGGLSPSLKLGYDGDLGNGPIGVGWCFAQPGIRRSTRLGVPHYDATDELDVSGLVPGLPQLVATGGGAYRVEGEGNAYRGVAVDGGFELTAPDGKVYRFGTTALGRKASGAQVATWYLESVRDVAGQVITYHHHQDGGEVYMDSIEWGPTVGGAAAFRAELVYEARSDAVVSYRTGFRVASAQRLAQIKIWSFGAVRRTIGLSYDATFALSRLSSVQLAAADGTALPALAFHYASASPGAVQAIPGLAGWALNLQGTSFADVDGDGAPDLLRLTATGHSYRRNLGGTFDAPRTLAGAAGASLDQARLLDLTGDSSPELVRQQGSQWAVYQLTGDPINPSWSSLGSWAGAANVSLTSVTVADFNGDQMMDIASVSGSSIQVRYGSATGLAAPVLRGAIDPTRSYIAPGNAATSFPDINGDGLADAVYLGTSSMYLYLGRGDGTFEHYRDLAYPWTGSVATSAIRLGDLDRDGLMDLAVIRGGNVEWYRGLANGAVSTTPVAIARPAGTDASVVVALADADGNGSEDVVWSSDAGMWILDMAGPTSAGMLASIDNGLGENQAFGYAASAQLALAATTPWATTLPISVPVAVTTRVSLASGEPARSTRLDVRDGIYDRGERRFIGFSQSTTSRPDPADGAPAAQIVRQIRGYASGLGLDRELRGELVSELTETGDGTLIQDVARDVAAVTITGLATDDGRLRRAVVRSSETHHDEGLASPLVSRIEYSYDGEGRELEQRKLGRLDLAGDETITRTRYTDGVSARGVRDQVCERWIVGLDGTTEVPTRHSQILYGDDTAVAALCDAGAGWVRSERDYLDSDARWIERKATTYSAHGNPLHVTQDGVTRELSYDAYDLHVIAETTRPSASRALTWQLTWDNVIGQPTSLTEATGGITRITSDGLGRVTGLARDGQPAYLAYRYHAGAPRPYVETWQFDGAPDAVTAAPATWAAGLHWRRALTAFTSASEPAFKATQLDGGHWIIDERRQRDAIGRTSAIADAFDWAGGDPIAAALPVGPALRTVSYDALDRPVVETAATGGHRTFGYRAFETTETTDGMAPVVSALDGQDRIVHTARTVGSTVESVDASYDAEGRITRLRLPAAAGNVDHDFVYDALGRLMFATDPDLGDRNLTYDDGGRLLTEHNGAGQITSYAYDGVGRLTSSTSGGTAFAYHYDDPADPAYANTAGRLAYVDEPTGRVQLGYDALGREVRRNRAVGGKTADQLHTIAPSGLVLGSDDGDGLVLAMAYDAAGRATGISAGAASLWTVQAQDAAGRVLGEQFGNGVVQGYARDLDGRPTHLTVTGSATLYDATVGYTAYGAIASIADHDGVGLDHSATFGFDGAARLIDAAIGSGAAAYHFHYAYDGLQNMIERDASGPTALAMMAGSHHYGEAGRGPRQLTSIGTGGAAMTLAYDGAGRTIRQGATTMDYDGFDRLVAVHTGGGAIAHDYGYDGMRVRTTDASGAHTVFFDAETWETDDGARRYDVRVADRLIAQITRGPATAPAVRVGALIRGAIVIGGGLGLLVIVIGGLRGRRRVVRPVIGLATLTALLAAGCGDATTLSTALSESRMTTQILYYHQTTGPAPALITRADGSVLDERRYEPYGAPIDARHDGATTTVSYDRDPHNALNKLSDPDNGWSDHGARWQTPETARWLSPDPPVKAPDGKFLRAPWGLNPYQYVKQNPVQYWDPDGREEKAKEPGMFTEGALELFTGTDEAFGRGLDYALLPLRSDKVPTGLKIAYAIVAPIPMVFYGAVFTVGHVVWNAGKMYVVISNKVDAGAAWVGRKVYGVFVTVHEAKAPNLDHRGSAEPTTGRATSTAHEDPLPAAPSRRASPRADRPTAP